MRQVGHSQTNKPLSPTKFILMNTVAVQNPDLAEKRTWFEQRVFTLFHYLLPPHSDNEAAAEYLHDAVGRESKYVEWCSVRPGSLIDAEVSAYDIAESPSPGAFSGDTTTRSNVAHFMAELIEDAVLWNTWRFRMPVVTNAESPG